ncbi:hypothetical protein ACU686_41940 [Yinghuangia aomiensis]
MDPLVPRAWTPLEPGDPAQVGPYTLLGRLGAGGMGQVFLARSPRAAAWRSRPSGPSTPRPRSSGPASPTKRPPRPGSAARSPRPSWPATRTPRCPG